MSTFGDNLNRIVVVFVLWVGNQGRIDAPRITLDAWDVVETGNRKDAQVVVDAQITAIGLSLRPRASICAVVNRLRGGIVADHLCLNHHLDSFA